LICPIAKNWRDSTHIESGGRFDVLLETSADQLLAGDRRAEDRGEVSPGSAKGVACYPRLGRKRQVKRVEDRACPKQILDGRSQAAIGPLLGRRDNADGSLSSDDPRRRGDRIGVTQATGKDRDRTTG
jgi:hypothetical protein